MDIQTKTESTTLQKPTAPGIKTAVQIGQLSLMLCSSILACTIIGYWIDQWIHAFPMCTLLGLVIGTIIGFYSVFQFIKRL